ETMPTRPTASGERRSITVLFADIAGSTSIAERMDPEDWTTLVGEAFKRMTSTIEHYDGTVARLMGDAVLAFFGAPVAHEDDPQRAVLAGLEMVAAVRPFREQIYQRYQLAFDVRVGINTGLVVVGQVGSELRVEYTAMGDAGLDVPLVGRSAELHVLRAALDDLRQGQGRVVCLIGEPGLGKSRLIGELRVAWEAAGLAGRWHTASSLSYETGQPYGLCQHL